MKKKEVRREGKGINEALTVIQEQEMVEIVKRRERDKRGSNSSSTAGDG
jgi:hypothetical protein